MFWTEFVLFEEETEFSLERKETLILAVAAPEEVQARRRMRREETVLGLAGLG